MRAELLSDALGQLDDSLLEEARLRRERTAPPRPAWGRWGALAACLAVAVLAGSQLLPQKDPPSVSTPGDLPLLTLGEGDTAAMGYEGYMAYDIDELVNANPWTPEARLDTLPVYRNAVTYDDNHRVQNADFDRMETQLVSVAVQLELDPTLPVTDNTPSPEHQQAIRDKFAAVGDTVPEGYFDPDSLVMESDSIKLTVDETLTVTIAFQPPVELPEEYDFTHNATLEAKEAVAGHLSVEYAGLLSGMEQPALNLTGGDRDIYGEQSYQIEFYDAGGSLEDQVVNYNFNRVAFYCDDDGRLFLARVYAPDLSQKLGDYPVITPAQAEQLLADGNYTTSVPYQMPGLEHLGKVELVYRTGPHEKTYLPYYRFLVELPEEQRPGGMKDYGAYYVPAVEGQYIASMPKWDGGFNY